MDTQRAAELIETLEKARQLVKPLVEEEAQRESFYLKQYWRGVRNEIEGALADAKRELAKSE